MYNVSVDDPPPPMCTRCRNHNRPFVPLKDHKKICPWKDCECEMCILIKLRGGLNKDKERLMARKDKEPSKQHGETRQESTTNSKAVKRGGNASRTKAANQTSSKKRKTSKQVSTPPTSKLHNNDHPTTAERKTSETRCCTTCTYPAPVSTPHTRVLYEHSFPGIPLQDGRHGMQLVPLQQPHYPPVGYYAPGEVYPLERSRSPRPSATVHHVSPHLDFYRPEPAGRVQQIYGRPFSHAQQTLPQLLENSQGLSWLGPWCPQPPNTTRPKEDEIPIEKAKQLLAKKRDT